MRELNKPLALMVFSNISRERLEKLVDLMCSANQEEQMKAIKQLESRCSPEILEMVRKIMGETGSMKITPIVPITLGYGDGSESGRIPLLSKKAQGKKRYVRRKKR